MPAEADPFLHRLGASVRLVARLPRERRTPWRGEAAIRAARDARLRALVRHAADHVPHYRDLFAERDVSAVEITSADDLTGLPILDKEAVQRDPNRFRSSAPEAVRALPFPTSGSSGTPLVFFHDRRALLHYLLVSERDHDVPRRLLGRGRHRTVTIGHSNSTSVRARAAYRRLTLVPGRPGRVRISPEWPVETIVDTLAESRPDVLAGWGNTIEWLFRLAAAGEIRMHLPKLVHYFAEAMSDDGRRLIEVDFGIPVISTYSAVETFGIGFFCERRTGFHLHEDSCHVRVVRTDGTDAELGEAGDVAVSNLVNRGTVLLNYRLGDVAALLPGPCPCGRTLRLLSPVQGRISEIIRLEDGTRVHPFSVAAAVREEGLLRFQLVQEAPRRFRLEVVTTDEEAYGRVVRSAAPRLRDVLHGAQIDVVQREALDDSPRRKFRRVVALDAGGDR